MKPGMKLHRFVLVSPEGESWFDNVQEAFKARDASRSSGVFVVYVTLEPTGTRFRVLRP